MHLVTTAHGWVQMTGRTPLYYKIDRACMKWYERVLCVSQDLVERCEESGIPRERLRIVDNAIVESDYDTSAPADAQRRRFGFGPHQIILGAVGRLSEEKGFDVLLEAVGCLVEEGRNIGLVIAGEGGLKIQLQDRIKHWDCSTASACRDIWPTRENSIGRSIFTFSVAVGKACRMSCWKRWRRDERLSQRT